MFRLKTIYKYASSSLSSLVKSSTVSKKSKDREDIWERIIVPFPRRLFFKFGCRNRRNSCDRQNARIHEGVGCWSIRQALVDSGCLSPRGRRVPEYKTGGRVPEYKTAGIHEEDFMDSGTLPPCRFRQLGGGRVPESKRLCSSRRLPR